MGIRYSEEVESGGTKSPAQIKREGVELLANMVSESFWTAFDDDGFREESEELVHTLMPRANARLLEDRDIEAWDKVERDLHHSVVLKALNLILSSDRLKDMT